MSQSVSVNHVVQVTLKNVEYLPLFYLMPKRILQEYHFSIKLIPRVPREILDQPFHFIPESLIDRVMKIILPRVMQRYNLTEVFKVTEQYRCFEDFRSRRNQRRTDFYRKWYHTRTKHPMISLEEYQDLNAEQYDGQRRFCTAKMWMQKKSNLPLPIAHEVDSEVRRRVLYCNKQ